MPAEDNQALVELRVQRLPLPAPVLRGRIVEPNASRTDLACLNACLGRANTRNIALPPSGIALGLGVFARNDSLLCPVVSDLALLLLACVGLLCIPTLHACAKEPHARARDATEQDHE